MSRKISKLEFWSVFVRNTAMRMTRYRLGEYVSNSLYNKIK